MANVELLSQHYLEKLSKTKRTLSQDSHILAKNRTGDIRKKSSSE
jgi:hypothetical protein